MSAEPIVSAFTRDAHRDPGAWRAEIMDARGGGSRFAGLFGSDVDGGLAITALLARADGVDAVDLMLPPGASSYPALTPTLTAAFWYERELHDLFGVTPDGHPRLDPLVLPLLDSKSPRPRPGAADCPEALTPDEAMLPRMVTGEGLFTIPHGPVRSGVVESIEYLIENPGEEILHPQIRVYVKHRGLEKRFEGLRVDDGVLLAERVEGIASVAHALAFAHAVESLAGVEAPPAAAATRVIHAELERIANHLDVVIKLAEAAGLAVAIARFGWHKERIMRLVSRLCGNRFGRGVVVPGGVTAPIAVDSDALGAELTVLERSIGGDERELMGSSTFLDRLRRTGVLLCDLAADHGALGPIGRASAVVDDTRVSRPYDAYPQLVLAATPHSSDGDAMARLRVRWAEMHDAFALARQSLPLLAAGPARTELIVPDGRGIGWAEAPQGEVLYVVEVEGGRITRCKPRSASFHNLVLFHSVFHGDVLTDFPFIEASFGLSPAGVVL
jgi:Ni,Fe-hydrogenase III large subunit